MNILKLTARKKAREFAVQAIYSWQLSCDNDSNIKCQLIDEIKVSEIDHIYFQEIYYGVIKNYKELDSLISLNIYRKIDEIGYVEKAILRIAAFELIRKKIPYKVVINEAIEKAKKFGSQGSHRFVNGVLDKLASRIR